MNNRIQQIRREWSVREGREDVQYLINRLEEADKLLTSVRDQREPVEDAEWDAAHELRLKIAAFLNQEGR